LIIAGKKTVAILLKNRKITAYQSCFIGKSEKPAVLTAVKNRISK